MDAIPRRLFLGGAFGTLALKPPRTAQADTPFTSFSFAATGAPTARTMPDRLSDVINVKDWGAKGNGSTNDQPAIQAAINYCISKGGGQVFFPPSNKYGIKSPLVVGDASATGGVQLVGAGYSCSVIQTLGGYSDPGYGAAISKGASTNNDLIERVENLGIANSQGGGSLKVGRTGTVVSNCSLTDIDASAATGALIVGCTFQGGGSRNGAASPNPGDATGTIGIALGNQGTALNVRQGGTYDVAFALAGYNPSVVASSGENHNTLLRFGWSPQHVGTLSSSVGAGVTVLPFTTLPPLMIPGRSLTGTNIPANTTIVSVDPDATPKTVTISHATTGTVTSVTFGNECPAIGSYVSSIEAERCNTNFDLYNCQGVFLNGCQTRQGDGTPDPHGPISSLSWSSTGGGTVTATTPAAHNFPNATWASPVTGGYLLQLDTSQLNGNNAWLPSTGTFGLIVASLVDSTHFSWTGVPVNPGSFNVDRSGNALYWNYPPQYSVRVRKATECVI